MFKSDRTNEILLQGLAEAVSRAVFLENALITVTYVDCSPDLKQAKVGISVLPDRLAGTALRKLKTSTGDIINILKKTVRLRRFPRLNWEFDSTEREADKIEKLIAEI